MAKLVKIFPGENFGLPILSSLHDSFIDLKYLPYSRNIWWGIKFGGLAV